MATCPCCTDQLLRHIRHQQVYWFCRHCWQEMSLIEETVQAGLERFTLPQRHLALNVEQAIVARI